MGVTAFSLIAGAALGAATKSPKIGKPKTPPAPPLSQEAKAPSGADARTGVIGTGQAGGSSGVGQTLLTGSTGINAGRLKLGKSALLGS